MEAKETFRILSIDGGGIRGIIPLALLTEMETELRRSVGEQASIVDHFDLICGTSTGGIIALSLALGMSAEDILELYQENAEVIFPRKKRLLPRFFQPEYDYSGLYSLLKEKYEKLTSDGDTRLGHARTRLCIPTYNTALGQIHIYKTSHHSGLTRDYAIPAHDVAMSTAAAPTFFRPHTFAYESLADKEQNTVSNNVDGGVFANNPSLIAVTEALYGLQIPIENIKLLSLGTGRTTFTEASIKRRFGKYYWIKGKKIIDLLLATQAVHTDNILGLIHGGIGGARRDFCYTRIDHEFEKGESIELSETDLDKLSKLEEIGRALYRQNSGELTSNFLTHIKQDFKPYKTL